MSESDEQEATTQLRLYESTLVREDAPSGSQSSQENSIILTKADDTPDYFKQTTSTSPDDTPKPKRKHKTVHFPAEMSQLVCIFANKLF